MRAAIITIAGISSRFNEGIPEEEKTLKAIYTNREIKDKLLYHLVKKCSYADLIVLVGGYRYQQLIEFISDELRESFPQIVSIENKYYTTLSSGYSLYLGIREAIKNNADEILFAEGDLDVDDESFSRIIASDRSVLTYNYEPIYTNKAVILYKGTGNLYQYTFSNSHGMVTISEPFSCIFNSGQIWKFTKTDILKKANDQFYLEEKEGTNLAIIQRYINLISEDMIQLIGLRRWTNCNTREDYQNIMEYWRKEQ